MKKFTRVMSAALLAASISTSYLPVFAEDAEGITKDESVFAVLESDGSVREIVVTDQLHSNTGFSNYVDASSLKEVTNLKSQDEVQTTDGGLVWNNDANDIYYQGKSDQDLPLDIQITYTLDGKEMKEEDLLGKSGHVAIRFNITNKDERTYTVNGKEYNLVTPFVTVAGGMLDLTHFQNVTINHGTVESDSSHVIVGGVMLPGLRKGLSSVLTYDLMDRLSDYLIDDLTIEADVTDFVSPSLMLAAGTDMNSIKDEIRTSDLTTLFDDLDQLQEATDALLTGTQDLYDGAVKLSDGAKKAKDGSSQLSDGAAQLLSGIDALQAGAEKLSGGSSALVAGLETLNANNGTLNTGAASLNDGVFQIANKVLETFAIPTVTPENYANVLAGEFDVTPEQIALARNEIASQVAAINGAALSDEDFAKLLFYAATTGDQTFTAENLQQAAGSLQKAAAAGQQVAAAAGIAANGVQDEPTMNLVTSMRDYLASHPTQEQLQMAYDRVLGSVTANETIQGQLAAFGITDDAQVKAVCEQVVAYAISNHGADALTNPAFLAEGLQAYAGAAAQGNALVEAAGLSNPAVNAVCTGFTAQTISATSVEDVYGTLVQQLMANGAEQSTAALVLAYGANYVPYEGQAPASYLTAVATTLTNLQSLSQALEANYNTEASQQLINSKLTDAYLNGVKGNEDLKSVKQLLDGSLALKAGIAQYTAGAAAALDGARQLADGTQQVTDGTGELKNGGQILRDGMTTLDGGLGELRDGSDKLADGAKTLKEGMQKYNDEGISKLTKNEKIRSLQDTADLLNAIKDDDNHYENYSGISEGTSGTVKFVFKVDGAKETKTTTTTTEVKKENKTFFQRIADLFHFGA